MLIIQKVVVLLDEFHLKEFRKYLVDNKAELPLKLVDEAKRIVPKTKEDDEKDSDELCMAIYKKSGTQEKKKFFQLAHHTFKLTAYLSRNYPSYLLHNISRIEHFVNQGKLKDAGALAEILLEVSEKIEDFATSRAVLQFFAQHAYMREKKTEAVRFLERNAAVIESEKELNDIYHYLRSNLHFKDKNVPSLAETEKHLSYFGQYHAKESFAVRIMGRYASIFTLHFLNDDRFYHPSTLDELNAIADELEKSPYVVFSFSDDIELNIDYLKLKILVAMLSPDDLQEAAAALLKKRETPRFWKNYLNTGQIAFLSIQAGVLVSRFGFGYRKGWLENLPKEIKDQIAFYKKSCEEIIASQSWNEENLHVRFININNIYCCFLLLGTQDEIKQVPKIIEGLLFNYQQVAFHRIYDQIFATMIMSYFIQEDYVKVQECYKRYEKLTANSSKLPENDITVKAYYYVSQWIHSGRKQYQEKLNALLEKTEGVQNLETVRLLILDLKEYFAV
jgi:hypothetical protein